MCSRRAAWVGPGGNRCTPSLQDLKNQRVVLTTLPRRLGLPAEPNSAVLFPFVPGRLQQSNPSPNGGSYRETIERRNGCVRSRLVCRDRPVVPARLGIGLGATGITTGITGGPFGRGGH